MDIIKDLNELELVARRLEEIQYILAVSAVQSTNQSVKSRCYYTELVLRSALMMLRTEANVATPEDRKSYIANKLSNGLVGYGLDVIDREPIT